jgi:hypothetical protein
VRAKYGFPQTLKMLVESADSYDMLVSVRGLEDALFDEVGNTSEVIPPALEPVIEAFEHGTLWLEIARETSDLVMRHGLAAMAKALLMHARDLLLRSPAVAPGTPQHDEWLMAIEDALRESSYM